MSTKQQLDEMKDHLNSLTAMILELGGGQALLTQKVVDLLQQSNGEAGRMADRVIQMSMVQAGHTDHAVMHRAQQRIETGESGDPTLPHKDGQSSGLCPDDEWDGEDAVVNF